MTQQSTTQRTDELLPDEELCPKCGRVADKISARDGYCVCINSHIWQKQKFIVRDEACEAALDAHLPGFSLDQIWAWREAWRQASQFYTRPADGERLGDEEPASHKILGKVAFRLGVDTNINAVIKEIERLISIEIDHNSLRQRVEDAEVVIDLDIRKYPNASKTAQAYRQKYPAQDEE